MRLNEQLGGVHIKKELKRERKRERYYYGENQNVLSATVGCILLPSLIRLLVQIISVGRIRPESKT